MIAQIQPSRNRHAVLSGWASWFEFHVYLRISPIEQAAGGHLLVAGMKKFGSYTWALEGL